MTTATTIGIIAYIVLGPVLGCFLAGLDRKITARMQGRVGPPILQPFYDVRKLMGKQDVSTNPSEKVYMIGYLATVIVAGALFFGGQNFLLVVFLVTLASLFLIVAAYSSRSPYAEVGAQREILQVASYEPMVILIAVGFYMATGSFDVSTIITASHPAIVVLPLLFIGFLYILIVKLRKSPFDLSTSEHAHQELVKGVTTEMSGPTLALFEVAHWYETVLFFGWVGLFAIWQGWVGLIVALLVCAVVYLLMIFIDNNFARVKWQKLFNSSWWLAFVFGAINLSAVAVLAQYIPNFF